METIKTQIGLEHEEKKPKDYDHQPAEPPLRFDRGQRFNGFFLTFPNVHIKILNRRNEALNPRPLKHCHKTPSRQGPKYQMTGPGRGLDPLPVGTAWQHQSATRHKADKDQGTI